ncbi:CapA family protein [Streptomyces sp. 2P-4]|uniref:CapA family protein n=1 Tax=Streptomyces sp. 2P-4 TaxID=2931974 RepID=UPI002540EAE7|nr:CapA family protein [Streptomyces sp. 2P-4]
MGRGPVTLALCGDVMLGRGIDQILPHPGNPALREGGMADARGYVALAEAAHGPLPALPVGFDWPWGEALAALDGAAPDARIVNLETGVTLSGDFAPGKAVHYRMHPRNLPCLAAVRPDVCVLANNHVMDFGRRGLRETLRVLARAGLRTAGAGRDAESAGRAAEVPLGGGHRLTVLAFGMPSSGIPPEWAATGRRAGVAYVDTPDGPAARALAERVREEKRPGDIAVVSVHWGSNWGYGVPAGRAAFARALVDAGADVVHGHSSHHARPLELYRGKLILHGCGDFVDDYEGIGGYERYRDDLRPLYLAALDPDTGRLESLRITVFRPLALRLHRASAEDAAWLRELLERTGRGLRTAGGGGDGGGGGGGDPASWTFVPA